MDDVTQNLVHPLVNTHFKQNL